MQTLRLTHRLDLRLVDVLGGRNVGVNEIGEASPLSSATKQNNFYRVLNCLVLFYYDPNKRHDSNISVFKEKSECT